MPDIRLELILIGLVIIGAVLLVVTYIWVFMIQRSPLKLIMMFLPHLLNRDRLVDPNAPIEISDAPHRSQSLVEQSNMFKESNLFPDAPISANAQSVGVTPAFPVQKALLNERDVHAADETTSDNGWPVRLDKATRQSRRPFLHIKLDSEKDHNPTDNQP
jgi:hypothetical protein